MTQERRQQLLQFAGIVFAALPFLFSVIGMAGHRHDFRMLWMASAALVGVVAVVVVARIVRRQASGVLARALAAFVVATVLAAWMGFRLGATAAIGVWLVALVLSFCWAAGYAFVALSFRERPEASA